MRCGEAVEGDWRKDSTVILNTRDVNEDMRVMIPCPIENTLVGPFRVRYDEDLDELVIYPSLDQKNSIISGYLYSPSLADRIHTLEQIDVTRGYVRIEGEGIEPCPTDTISDEELIENFTASIKGKTAKTIGVDPAAFASLLASYQNSLISGKDIPAALAAERVKRLQAIFESSAKTANFLMNFPRSFRKCSRPARTILTIWIWFMSCSKMRNLSKRSLRIRNTSRLQASSSR